jgi:hypothetical protein
MSRTTCKGSQWGQVSQWYILQCQLCLQKLIMDRQWQTQDFGSLRAIFFFFFKRILKNCFKILKNITDKINN